MRDREAFLRRFHDARPGVTSAALGRAGSYERLASRAAGRVLDLACGDGHLLRLLGPRAVGIDLSRGELSRARGLNVVQGRAQELPFADRSFDTITCHLAFMLFDDLDAVVAEVDRVLAPGGVILALQGGGPTAEGRDAFHVFAEQARGPGVGNARRIEDAFAGWNVQLERWALDLSGPFDDVWRFLGASYQSADPAPVRAAFPADPVPCTVVTYLATITR